MDDETLKRLARVLPIIPPELSEAELDNRLTVAAEREAAGTPVAVSDRDLAAYMALHPDAAEEYAALVEALREELPNTRMPQLRSSTLRWAPASGLRRSAAGQERAGATYERDWAEVGLRTHVRLRVADMYGQIFVELLALDDRRLAHEQVELTLASGLGSAADGPPPTPLDRQPLGRRGSALFADCEPGVDYTLRIALPNGHLIEIDLSADLWP